MKNRILILGLALLALLSFASCGKGIETGNPEPEIQIGNYIISSPLGKAMYQVEIRDDQSAVVRKMNDQGEIESEAIGDAIIDEGTNTFTITVSFPDGTEVTVTGTLSENGSVLSIEVAVNGISISIDVCLASGDRAIIRACDSVGEKLAAAMGDLSAGNIASARDAFSSVIDDGNNDGRAGKASEPDNSTARFGRALADLLMLIERAPFTAMLAGLGQPEWKLDSIFAEDGVLAQSLIINKPDLSRMPFRNIKECVRSKRKHHRYMSNCLVSRAVPGYHMVDLAQDYGDLMVYVSSIIDDLEVAISDGDASFLIPRELYSGDFDIRVGRIDMVQILAGMHLIKASAEFANSWQFDFDLGSYADRDGHLLLNKEQQLEILNSQGQFSLRADNQLAAAHDDLQSFFQYSIEAIGAILDMGEIPNGILNRTNTNMAIYQDLYDMAVSANESFDGATTIAGILPSVDANLQLFFANPPDSSEIEMDPFILEHNRIQAVEGYWQQMINKGCNFEISRKHVKFFSEATRTIHRPYYELFSNIMGHHFGKYRAGRGQ